MFGIGGTELLIILVFVFIVVGPEKLPEAATMIGKAIRKFQDAQSEVNKVIKTETADIKAAINNEPKAAEKAPARKPAVKKEAAKPAETKAEAAAEEAPAERPLSFSERKAQYQRERKEREEAAKRAAEDGKEE